MSPTILRLVPTVAVVLFLSVSTARADDGRVEFFEKKVRPVLVKHCYNCHSANTNTRGGLRVDDRNGLLEGGDSGPAVVPGAPDKSLLILAVRYRGRTKMPPKTQLSATEIADLERWVKEGAAWPAEQVPVTIGQPNPRYDKLRKEHWAWQPLKPASAPQVQDKAWPRDDIDRFVLAALESKGLAPVADADRATLLRRVTFDLTGLPPTPAEIDAFSNDTSPEAFEKVVDRLLASPAYGERLGRRWLDLARYAESTGSGRNVPYPHAWRYRDYVIDAFNADKPYDRFVQEQIAGDLLPASSRQERDQLLIATGFLALGVKDVNQRFKVRFIMDNIDEQIDTLSRSILGLTVSCARCHDHKFDPIPTADYYALAGIFHSTDLCAGVRNKMGGGGMDYYDPTLLHRVGQDSPLDPGLLARIERTRRAFDQAQTELESLRRQVEEMGGDGNREEQALLRKKMRDMQNQLLTLDDPAAKGQAALGVRDARNIGDTQIRLRGEAERLGPVVPRGFLSILDVPDVRGINPKQSGRLELARWLTSANNPLTARVIVNRLWHHLFGQGIVATVDNFGVTGDSPSHPELLDHLTERFVREGWSIKKLIRTLVLTRTYQLGGAAPQKHQQVDPANRLLWRHAPRRLEAEEIRDTMLAVGGNLDPKRPEGSPADGLKVMELKNAGPEAARLGKEAQACLQRSIYLPLLRGLTPRSLEVFDFAQQGMVTGDRDTTTVAPQALYMLNDPFVRRQSLALAERLLRQADGSARECVEAAYRLTMSRAATAAEIDRALAFLADYEAAASKLPAKVDGRLEAWRSFCQALLGSAEFRYVR
ncbi:MAG: PSD1 and planctomycete cytochrome C domain-containing protein [Gemmataceae bacterium]